jgi:hypothetical protein
LGNLKRSYHFEDQGTDMWVIIKWISVEFYLWCSADVFLQCEYRRRYQCILCQYWRQCSKLQEKKQNVRLEDGDGWQSWFWGFVLKVKLVTGGVEVKPGLPVEQEKPDTILTHMQNLKKKV